MPRPPLGFTGGETWGQLTERLRACITHVATFDATCATELDAVVYERERRLKEYADGVVRIVDNR